MITIGMDIFIVFWGLYYCVHIYLFCKDICKERVHIMYPPLDENYETSINIQKQPYGRNRHIIITQEEDISLMI